MGYILTNKQKEQIQGREFANAQFFNCVQDINGVWFNFVSEQQIPQLEASQYAWVLDLPQAEYTPPPTADFPI